MPEICSRRMRFTVSTESCIRRNQGSMRTTSDPTMIPSSGTATATSQDSPTSSRNAMKIPPIIMIGIAIMNIRPIFTNCWTC